MLIFLQQHASVIVVGPVGPSEEHSVCSEPKIQNLTCYKICTL